MSSDPSATLASVLQTAAWFNQAMLLIASRPQSLFLGQGVVYNCHSLYDSLTGVPLSQRIELPVMEEMQLGVSTGLALQGFLVCSLYPRMDFLLRAADQLIAHLDKLEFMARRQWVPKVIIRTRVGTKEPLDAGPQHTQNFVNPFRQMLTTVKVMEITTPDQILPTYREALNRKRSTLVVENLGT